MKAFYKGLIAGAFALTAMTGAVSAAQMQSGKMMGMMQCSAACSQQYMQCLMSANQMASSPSQGMAQLKSNFQGSTFCGQAAMTCNASCR